MTIEFTCPKGHKLKMKESSVGKTIRCPVCNSAVEVPGPPAEEMDEDAILGILGPHDPGRSPPRKPTSSTGEPVGTDIDTAGFFGPSKKPCPKCHREIQTQSHICPFCHTYVAKLDDF